MSECTVNAPTRFLRVALPVLVAATGVLRAAPDLSTKETLRGLTVVRDRENGRLFYFFPGPIEIARRDDGGSDLTFSVARYTGTVVHGDEGLRSIRPTFFARVRMAETDRAVRQAVERELSLRSRVNVTLRPMPIAKLEAQLVYAGSGINGADPKKLGTGFFEPAGGEGNSASMWKERDVFLLLDPGTAEILETQLRAGDLGLTLSYAFFSRAWIGDDARGELTTTGDRAATEMIEEALDGETATAAAPRLSVIAADAIPIVIPASLRESRIRRYDIDTTLPPDYPSLIAYCFDFRDGERPDLFEKNIEIEATGVAGGKTRHVATFRSDAPDVVAQTVRFRFAVDLRKPYRWRSEEILMSGESLFSPWLTSDGWTEIIDASSTVAPPPTDTTGPDPQ